MAGISNFCLKITTETSAVSTIPSPAQIAYAIESLISKGKTSLIKGMKSKAGKQFDAYIVLNEDHRTSFEFEKNKSYNK